MSRSTALACAADVRPRPAGRCACSSDRWVGGARGVRGQWGRRRRVRHRARLAPCPDEPRSRVLRARRDGGRRPGDRPRQLLLAAMERAVEDGSGLRMPSSPTPRLEPSGPVGDPGRSSRRCSSGGRCFLYDVSLPLGAMEWYAEQVEGRLRRRWPDGRLATLMGHVGDGNLHLFVHPGSATGDDLHEQSDDDVYTPLRDVGGSISAEHGIGIGEAALTISGSPAPRRRSRSCAASRPRSTRGHPQPGQGAATRLIGRRVQASKTTWPSISTSVGRACQGRRRSRRVPRGPPPAG